jgi:alpha-beta hydrolase superfamily lysophospholipase
MERYFFLEHHNKSVYCVEYLPQDLEHIKTGVIICSPIRGERIRTHRIFTSLARELQKMNHYVITCDYFGDGNSSGESNELTLESIADDIKAMCSRMLEVVGVKKYYAVGYRMGASVLPLTLDQLKINKAILIDPILEPVNFLTEALRANLTSQMMRYKKVIKNREVLIREIQEGYTINTDGFLIGREMWESFEKNTPIYANGKFKGDVIIISSENLKKRSDEIFKFSQGFKKARVDFVKKEVVLTSWKYYTQRPPIIFSKIFNEISNS